MVEARGDLLHALAQYRLMGSLHSGQLLVWPGVAAASVSLLAIVCPVSDALGGSGGNIADDAIELHRAERELFATKTTGTHRVGAGAPGNSARGRACVEGSPKGYPAGGIDPVY